MQVNFLSFGKNGRDVISCLYITMFTCQRWDRVGAHAIARMKITPAFQPRLT